MIRWVIFDAAGTLLHMQPAPETIYCEEAAQLSIDADPETLVRRFPVAYQQAFGDYSTPTDQADQRRRWFEVVQACFPHVTSPQIESLFNRLWDRFGNSATWKLDADCESVFESLRSSSIGIAIASNFDSRLRKILNDIPALADLDRVYISSEVGFSKPNPKFYQFVQSQLEAEAAELLMVGDCKVNDFETPKSLSWRALWLSPASLQQTHEANSVAASTFSDSAFPSSSTDSPEVPEKSSGVIGDLTGILRFLDAAI